MAGENESAVGGAMVSVGTAITPIVPVGTIVGAAMIAVGSVAKFIGGKKAKKDAENKARQAQAAAQQMYEGMAEKAAKIYQDEIARAQAASANITANMKSVQTQLEAAKAEGDQIAVESYQRQIEALNRRMTQEQGIIKEQYEKGSAELQKIEDAGTALHLADMKVANRVRAQFEASNAQALGREVTNRAYEDKVQKQVTEQALQEAGLESGTPRGLVAAQSKQDAEFAALKQEAERAAAARGEDPRRAALAVEMEQARAGGRLSADFRKNRIQELQQIAAGNRLSSGAAASNIAQAGLNAIPTEGARLAEYQANMGAKRVGLGQDYGSQMVMSIRAAGAEGSRLASDFEAGQQKRLFGTVAGSTDAQTEATRQQLGLLGGLRSAQEMSIKEGNAAYGQIAKMYGDAAAANAKAATDAKKQQEAAVSEGAKGLTEAWMKSGKTA